MRASVGSLFTAFQYAEQESSYMAEAIKKEEEGGFESFRKIASIHAVLHKALRDSNLEIELYEELDNILVPFFKKCNLEILSK